MFYLLQSRAHTEPRHFHLLLLPCQEEAGGAPGSVRGHSQDNWPRLVKGIFHTYHVGSCSVTKLGGLARGGRPLLVDGLDISQRQLHRALLALCILLLITIILVLYCHYFYYYTFLFYIIKLSLSHPTSSKRGVREQLRDAHLPVSLDYNISFSHH